MKFVIGWLKLRPGKREEFLALAHPYAAKCLAVEDGIEFFQFHPSSADADTVIVVEKYQSPEIHDLHQQTEHFRQMWKQVERLCTEGRFENIFADRVEPDAHRFEQE